MTQVDEQAPGLRAFLAGVPGLAAGEWRVFCCWLLGGAGNLGLLALAWQYAGTGPAVALAVALWVLRTGFRSRTGSTPAELALDVRRLTAKRRNPGVGTALGAALMPLVYPLFALLGWTGGSGGMWLHLPVRRRAWAAYSASESARG